MTQSGIRVSHTEMRQQRELIALLKELEYFFGVWKCEIFFALNDTYSSLELQPLFPHGVHRYNTSSGLLTG